MTAATQVIVIYSTESKILRRKIIPDSDSQPSVHQPGPGESRLLISLSLPYDDASCRAAIAMTTGVTPPSGRCCVVDGSGNVVGVCGADPALDPAPPGTSLVLSEIAGPGDKYSNGQFTRGYAVVDGVSHKVTALSHLPITNAVPPQGSYLVVAGNHSVGDSVVQRSVAAP
jgi:hypothetical protein